MRLSNICLIIFLLGAIVFPSAYAANALVNNSASTSTNQTLMTDWTPMSMKIELKHISDIN